ncbi:MAG: DHHA1 domain-containing protein [Coriobacteriales bacterium]|nr:DHHA1 domain-containing protein [Coriobacteriales bacterium]
MQTFDELYYREPYTREFDATVTSCQPHGDGFAVQLDQTAFYPTGGGQPGDRGTLSYETEGSNTAEEGTTKATADEPKNGAEAANVEGDATAAADDATSEGNSVEAATSKTNPDEKSSDEAETNPNLAVAHVCEAVPAEVDADGDGSGVLHLCDVAIPVGTRVHGVLDWTWRRDNMEAHTGEHVVSGIVHALFGYNNIGFHMGQRCIEVDFDGVLTEEDALDVERRANDAVRQDVPVEILLPTPQQLDAMDYRSKKAHEGQIRLVRIGSVDTCACCGTHVATTGQVGLIKVLRVNTKKKKSRLELLCGRRAFELVQERMSQLRDVSNFLSVGDEEVPEAVRRLSAEKDQLKHQLKQAMREKIADEVATLQADGGLLLHYEDGLEIDELRYLCECATQRDDVKTVVALSNVEGSADRVAFVMASDTVDLRPVCKQLNKQLNGRGGGKPQMVQGSWATTRDAAESAVRAALA